MVNITGATGTGGSENRNATQSEKDRTQLGQSDFLELMTTQLQNQDPMKPMENGEFMAQMAQFSSASGIQELSQSFQEFQSSMTGNQALEAASLVGRKVTVESNTGHLPEQGSLEGSIQLDGNVGNLTVAVIDGSGQRVAEVPLGERSAGDVDFSWDGHDAEGERLPSGTYELVAETDTDDGVVTHPIRIAGEVTSVALAGNGKPPQLTVDGLGDISLTDVRKVQ